MLTQAYIKPLDLSAASNTVDHSPLLDINKLGLTLWYSPKLAEVLGPKDQSKRYVLPLGQVMQNNTISCHADGTEFSPNSQFTL